MVPDTVLLALFELLFDVVEFELEPAQPAREATSKAQAAAPANILPIRLNFMYVPFNSFTLVCVRLHVGVWLNVNSYFNENLRFIANSRLNENACVRSLFFCGRVF